MDESSNVSGHKNFDNKLVPNIMADIVLLNKTCAIRVPERKLAKQHLFPYTDIQSHIYLLINDGQQPVQVIFFTYIECHEYIARC